LLDIPRIRGYEHVALLKYSVSNASLWPRRRFLKLLGAAALAPVCGASRSFALPGRSLNSLLIIGDSMALCGFGQRLDQKFRDAGVPRVNTYMACGTQPLSWTQLKNYAKAQSRCGFWSIESRGDGPPVSQQDTYGMRRGHRPSRYAVPKIEDLLATTQPDILVVQLGSNLFDLLKGREKTHGGEALDPFIAPFLSRVAESDPSVRRLFWVAPPASGTTPKEVQDLLIERLNACAGSGMRVIDSRELITYPYKHLQPDKQHFFGEDMENWANGVHGFIEKDLAASPLVGDDSLLVASEAGAEMPDKQAEMLVVQCSLEKINPPYRHEEIAPYNDSLVAFVYRVQHVLKGKFDGTHLVVLHAAHIAGKRQSMNSFSLGQNRILRLRPVEQTPWATLKSKDDPRFLELDRFIAEEDNCKLALHL
jgi:hypothetical protein